MVNNESIFINYFSLDFRLEYFPLWMRHWESLDSANFLLFSCRWFNWPCSLSAIGLVIFAPGLGGVQLCYLNHGCSSGHTPQWKAPGVRSSPVWHWLSLSMRICWWAGVEISARYPSALMSPGLLGVWSRACAVPRSAQGPRRVWLLLPKTSPKALGFWSPSSWAIPDALWIGEHVWEILVKADLVRLLFL